jgi:hypothetical protein
MQSEMRRNKLLATEMGWLPTKELKENKIR